MFYGTSTDLSVPLPITQTARETAEEFARQQPTAAKAEQVYRNTLAVCLVNNYLRMMGVATDLAASDSWNPVMRLSEDVADLDLPGQGKLECRAIAPHQSACPIPEDIQDDRLGYVLVQIDDKYQNASLLGFAEQAGTELSRNQLQSIETLFDCLRSESVPLDSTSEQSAPAGSPQALVPGIASGINYLSRWLQSIFEAGWQTRDVFFGLQLAYRDGQASNTPLAAPPASSIERVKPIALGSPSEREQFALLVGLDAQPEQTVKVRVAVSAVDGCSPLPSALDVKVLDEASTVVMQAQSRATRTIELNFGVELGDRFSVQVNLGNFSVTEAFLV